MYLRTYCKSRTIDRLRTRAVLSNIWVTEGLETSSPEDQGQHGLREESRHVDCRCGHSIHGLRASVH